jgi:hypothetical protein
VKIIAGPLMGLSGLYSGQKPAERVEVLLQMLGRVTLPKAAVRAV